MANAVPTRSTSTSPMTTSHRRIRRGAALTRAPEPTTLVVDDFERGLVHVRSYATPAKEHDRGISAWSSNKPAPILVLTTESEAIEMSDDQPTAPTEAS